MIRQYENKNTLEKSQNKAINNVLYKNALVLIVNNGIDGNYTKTLGYYTKAPTYTNYIEELKRVLDCKELEFKKLNDIQYKNFSIVFTDNSIIVNGKEWPLNENRKGFTYKVLKNKINVDTIEEFKKHIVQSCNVASPFYTTLKNLLEKLEA